LAIVAMLAGMTTYEAIVRYGWKRGSQRDWRCLLRPPWLELKASGGRCPAASSHYAPVQLSGRATLVGATGAPRAIQSLAALAEEANAAGVGTGVAGGIAVEEEAGHAVMVQGVREVNGVRQVVVRDPLQGAYMEPIAEFDARLVRDPQVLSHPIIWSER